MSIATHARKEKALKLNNLVMESTYLKVIVGITAKTIIRNNTAPFVGISEQNK